MHCVIIRPVRSLASGSEGFAIIRPMRSLALCAVNITFFSHWEGQKWDFFPFWIVHGKPSKSAALFKDRTYRTFFVLTIGTFFSWSQRDSIFASAQPCAVAQ